MLHNSAMSTAARETCPLPVLVGCSHGTADPAGQATVRALLDAVRAARPDLDVREAFVDVQQPEVDEVVAQAVAEGREVVVVPLLLSAGFHVDVDVTRSVASSERATASGALGPDDRLVDALVERLAEATGSAPLGADDVVVLAAAGSSSAGAVRDVGEVVEALGRRLGVPVTAGFGSIALPRLADAVRAARETGARRVVVASYLLAPGFFADRVGEAGGDVVSGPLGAHPAVVAVVLDRFAAGVGNLRQSGNPLP